MTKRIPLHGKYGSGKYALVDDEDYERLLQYKWRGHATGYARCSVYDKQKKTIQTILMHRLILDTPVGFHTDHRNGDRLDNRRCNLRIATEQQNSANSKPRGKTSIFKGVRFHKGLWQAQICTNYLGVFDTQCAAAQAYNEAAIKLFGEFAWLNDLSLVAPEDDLPIQRQGQIQSSKTTSRYLGVFFDKHWRKFIACVVHKRKHYYGGRFADEIEAAKARDELAKKLHGVLAMLNFPAEQGHHAQQSSAIPEQLSLGF